MLHSEDFFPSIYTIHDEITLSISTSFIVSDYVKIFCLKVLGLYANMF